MLISVSARIRTCRDSVMPVVQNLGPSTSMFQFSVKRGDVEKYASNDNLLPALCQPSVSPKATLFGVTLFASQYCSLAVCRQHLAKYTNCCRKYLDVREAFPIYYFKR